MSTIKHMPCRTKVCSGCPFRLNSQKGWLGRARAEEIANATSFVCHKNTKLQCAGAMYLNRTANQFFSALAFFNRVDLVDKVLEQNKGIAFEDRNEFIDHHANKTIKES